MTGVMWFVIGLNAGVLLCIGVDLLRDWRADRRRANHEDEDV